MDFALGPQESQANPPQLPFATQLFFLIPSLRNGTMSNHGVFFEWASRLVLCPVYWLCSVAPFTSQIIDL